MTRKKVKKSSRRLLISECDDLWAKAIKKRDNHKCVICGKIEGLSSAHIFSRRNFNTRFDLDNGITICFFHHIHWAHKEPIRFAEWVKNKLGEKKYQDLRIRADISAKGQDLKGIKLFLQQEVKRS